MDSDYRNALLRCATDVDGALERLCGNEETYLCCLAMFLQDTSLTELEQALADCAWDDAFTAVHALKGVAGNMGFIPLFHASAGMVIAIRAGRMEALSDDYRQIKCCYDEITSVIRLYTQNSKTA